MFQIFNKSRYSMDIDLILTELTAFKEKLPRQALEAAISRQAEITPHLLAVLEAVAKNPLTRLDRPDFTLPEYALYLLAFFKEPKAFPLIIKLFTTQDEDFIDTFGDFVTEDLCRVLASTYSGDLTPLNQLIESDNVDGFIRSAGLNAYVLLYLEGSISRSMVLAYFKELYEYKLVKEPSFIWDALICSSCDIHPNELMGHVSDAFGQDLIDLQIVNFESVQSTLDDALDKKLLRTQEMIGGYIGHPLEELKHFERTDQESFDEIKRIMQRAKLFTAKSPKIGRNEPCFCGSGKKYKKCCLNASLTH